MLHLAERDGYTGRMASGPTATSIGRPAEPGAWKSAIARTQRTCGWLTDEIMRTSKRLGRSPVEVAIERLAIDAEGRLVAPAATAR